MDGLTNGCIELLRKPETCSLARATARNKHNFKPFLSNLKSVMERHSNFAYDTSVHNSNETSTTTVQRPGKILALKGINPANVTSGERSTLVTTCCIVSATIKLCHQLWFFQEKNMHDTWAWASGTLCLELQLLGR